MSEFTPSGTPITPEQQRVYSLEEFWKRLNNFWLYFGGGMGRQYRQDSWYQRFETENTDLAAKLRSGIEEELAKGDPFAPGLEDRVRTVTKSLEVELYEAYKIMKSYGILNRDLNLQSQRDIE